MIFLEVDLSAIESRIMRALTRDPKMLEIARAHPADFDVHRFNAAAVFGVSERDVTKEQRYLAKRIEHSAQGGMHGARMSETLLLDGLVKTPDECDRWLAAYHARNAPIQDVYFPDIRKQMLRYGALANTWGRIWRRGYERLDDELFRKAYRFLPQSECVDLLNQWGLLPLWRWKTASNAPYVFGINVHAHDALLVSTHPANAYAIAEFLRDSLERPRIYAGEPLTVPIEYKLGSTWAGDYEWKRLPSQAEFTEAAYDCERKVKEREA